MNSHRNDSISNNKSNRYSDVNTSYRLTDSWSISDSQSSERSIPFKNTPSRNYGALRPHLVKTDSQKTHQASKRRSMIRLATLRRDNVGFYGRTEQVAQLQLCLDRLEAAVDANSKTENNATHPVSEKTELVLISGFSGTGKTTLAQQVYRNLPSGSAFANGKSDLNNRDEPYSCISDACETLCKKILDEDADSTDNIIDKVRNLLLDQLGLQVVQYLWNLIPSLRDIVTSENSHKSNDAHESEEKQEQPIIRIPSSIEVDSFEEKGSSLQQSAEAKRQQMNHAFRVFIQVMSSCYKPLVLLLDDLQWSDMPSLELIETLLTDVDHNQLLIVGCYRVEQLQDNEALPAVLERLRALKDTINITEILLENLTIVQCHKILLDLLSMEHDSTETEPLAALCHRRTLGNVNFLLQYISMLRETHLLDFNFGLMKWQWDLKTIEAQTNAADNVIFVVKKRMDHLSSESRHFLSMAASIGATTSRRILELAWKSIQPKNGEGNESCEKLLEEALNGNFLEPYGDDKYKFAHDKIQEAADKLLPREQICVEQFIIGMELLQELTESEKNAEIFLIRDLLDAKQDPTETEAETIVQINCLASERARSLSAFEKSLSYAKKGLSLLTEDSWKQNYDRTLQLYCLACEGAEFTGETELMEDLSKKVLERSDCPLLDKLRIYRVKMDRMANDGDPEKLNQATQLCIQLIKKLGCPVPWTPTVPFSVISSILHFKNKAPTEGVLRALPKLVDTEKVECMHLLYRLQGYAYFQKNFLLSTWAATKIAKRTLKYGRNGISSTSFPAIGMAMTGLFYEFQKGELYAKFGEALVDMEEDKTKEGRTTFTLVASYSYTRPIGVVARPLIRGYKSSMRAGDTESAMFSLGHMSWLKFMSGKPLHYLEADCHRFLAQAKQLERLNGVYFLSPLAELITALTGSQLGIETYLDNKTSDLLTDHLDLAHTIANTYLGNYREGADLYIQRGYMYDNKYPGQPIGQWDKFCGGVCLYDAAINSGDRLYRKNAEKVRSTIRSWVDKGNPNSNHQACLLDAESYRLKKNEAKASQFYENAAIMAGRAGLMHDAALIHERYAIHILNSRSCKQDEAAFRIRKAIELYTEWGADAKVSALQETYRDLLAK